MSNRLRPTAPTADRKPSQLQQVMEEARQLDLRRQRQVANQAEIIDRLLEDATYDTVFRETVEELSTAQVELDEARRELEEFRRGRPVV